LEGCPTGGVVNSPPLEGCPKDGVVFLGLCAEELCSTFDAAVRCNLFAQMQQKGFSLLSASPSAEEHLFNFYC